MNLIKWIIALFGYEFQAEARVDIIDDDMPEMTNFRNNITLLISAGHGGLGKDGEYKGSYSIKTGKLMGLGFKSTRYTDKGYHKDGWVIEGVLNRIYADDLREQAYKRGYKVKFIHDTADDVRHSVRCRRAQEVEGETCLLPIHWNAFNGKARGTEFYTTRGETKSDQLAELFAGKVWRLKRMFPELRLRFDSVSDGDSDKEANWKEIKIFEDYHKTRTTTGSCLYFEVAFFDNKEDLKMATDDRFMWQYNEYILDAIDEHYTKLGFKN